MPRWNKTRIEKIADVLDLKIKNLEPSLRRRLVDQLSTSDIADNLKLCQKFVVSELQLSANIGQRSKKYWTSRGWAELVAAVKVENYNTANPVSRASAFSREFWTAKINPATNRYYTVNEADFERNSRRPIRPEYWIKQGMCVDEAAMQAVAVKQKNNNTGANRSKNRTVKQARACSKRSSEYWTLRGYSNKDAATQVAREQTVFSLEICIEKYGPIIGKERWDRRQKKWQDTLNAKSPEEKSRVNRLKVGSGIVVSKAEREMLAEIVKTLPNVIHQFTLIKSNKKQYIYDFMYNNKIIEYNGDFWHANPNIYTESFVNLRSKRKATDIWQRDHEKNQFAIDNGYQVLVVWEQDYKRSPKEVIEQCIQFLNQ